MTPATLAFIGNLGGTELIVILVIVLVLFGAKKLPELARGLGQSMNEFKRARDDFERELHTPVDEIKIEEPKDKTVHKSAN